MTGVETEVSGVYKQQRKLFIEAYFIYLFLLRSNDLAVILQLYGMISMNMKPRHKKKINDFTHYLKMFFLQKKVLFEFFSYN